MLRSECFVPYSTISDELSGWVATNDQMESDVPIKSAKTTFGVVEALASLGRASLSEIMEKTNMPRSTTHNYLKTLEDLGYVVREQGYYRISTRFLAIGAVARKKMQVFRIAKPEIDTLAEETGEHASLMIEESGLGVLPYISKGEQALDLGVSVGWRMALPTNAPGKAILAYLPEEQVETILDAHGLPAVTAATITDRSELLERLETIRERGYATDFGERVEGVRAVAVPIVVRNRVHGAIAISGPANRMSGSWLGEDLPDLLLQAANVIEVQYTLGERAIQ